MAFQDERSQVRKFPRKLFTQLDICFPVVSALIEQRARPGQLLVQTRHKPRSDPVYTGTMEIAAGWLERRENVYDALRREVNEETGLTVEEIEGEPEKQIYTSGKGSSMGFRPFYAQQQLDGGEPWIGYAFLCKVGEGVLKAQKGETKDLRWMEIQELERMLRETPENVFDLQVPVLREYVKYRTKEGIIDRYKERTKKLDEPILDSDVE